MALHTTVPPVAAASRLAATGRERHPGARPVDAFPLAAAVTLAVGGGLLHAMAFPPVGAWPLAFVAPAPLIIALSRSRPRRGLALGLAYGLVAFGLTLSWASLFGTLAWTALTLLVSASTAVFGWSLPLLLRAGHPVTGSLAAASLWTVIEWIRGAWPLGGFTWASLGISQVPNRVSVRIAVIAGVWGVTFLVVLVASLVAHGTLARGSLRLRLLSLAVLAAGAPIVVPFAEAEGRPVDVAAIQVDFREGLRAPSREDGDVVVTRLNVRMHRQLRGDPPQLVVWGESALDPASLEILGEVRRATVEVGAPVLAGSTSVDIRGPRGGTELFNQAAVFDRTGAVIDVYRKSHLVPFGEYIPWKSAVGWISALDRIAYELRPGDGARTVTAPGLPPVGTPICFENAFPALDRRFIRAGARFLVVLTNNASYGRTAASAQHLQMSRMRAIETGRWVVHAAVSGISAFIDPSGRTLQETGLFEPATIRRTIRASATLTPYVRFGDWLPVACSVAVIGFVAFGRSGRRRSRRHAAIGKRASS